MSLLAWGAAWKAGTWRSGSWEGVEAPPAVVEQYTGGWPEPPDEKAVRRQRERMGILPPTRTRKTPPRAPQPVPYEWREPSFEWSAATDLPRLDRTLDQLADEARFADLVAAERIAAALRAAQERREALLREESDLTYVLAALAAGRGTPVTHLVAAQPAAGEGEEADLAFIIATLAAIA